MTEGTENIQIYPHIFRANMSKSLQQGAHNRTVCLQSLKHDHLHPKTREKRETEISNLSVVVLGKPVV